MPHSKYDSPDHHDAAADTRIFNPFVASDARHDFDRQPSPIPTVDRQDIIRRLKTRVAVDTAQDRQSSPTRIPLVGEENAPGLDIPRPRSALHRGDFSQDDDQQHTIATSPVVPWHAHSQFLQRPRAASQASLSGSFSYQPPTSPLVHQANAADMPGPDSEHLTPARNSSSLLHRQPSLRTFPYQAHQPRRSIGSISGLPQSPFPSARRPSITDASPLQHAHMVGSYEESILRGRMSTTPSKPLDFVAQIGVLGKGDCKPSLKCPPHVSIPFPAVFYSYASGIHHDPEPSPYVGMLDLENALNKTQDTEPAAPRPRPRHQHDREHSRHTLISAENDDLHHNKATRRQHKLHKRPTTTAPSGSYRIPEIGQLQIVIKNPNKTAVKLFLVPYDLSDMPPGTKTFIRQRSYSVGPIIDQPISNLTRFPDAGLTGKPILRYLIHLNICSTQKGRYYLYGGIRVVFANRVPDGKEKLRTEMQMPEPRFSIWKPASATPDTLDVAAKAKEAAKRRRSAVFPSHASSFDMFPQPSSGSVDSTSSFQHLYFRTEHEHLPTLESRPESRAEMHMDVELPDRFQNIAWQREDRGEEAFVFGRRDGSVDSKARQESLLSRKLRDLDVRGRG
ncbi:hypothetical protein E4T44_01997 [Aureobasidium sp. EXF-8845]|nr:hypothetical protein E4T44_01997 [Aureobasidium sp. EXF-8845]KAI4855588.1 hypothetical protein E4T45_02968 [Aureobasidium sp. EXF-8846]